MEIILLLFLSGIPRDNILEDKVDIVELNTIVDGMTGRIRFIQYIFWEWDPYNSIFLVVDWRRFDSISRQPSRHGRIWKLTWSESTGIRRVLGNEYKKTLTVYDPEVVNRKILPTQRRRKLTLPYVHKTLPIPSPIRYSNR